MSFGGFGGFGQQNNQATGGFGFGSNNNNTSAFGSSSTPAFGGTNTNTGGGLFGGSSGTGAFGNTGGAFGASSNNAFGAKPAFGAPATTSSGGGLFGSTTTTAGSTFGGGGFGNNNAATSSTGFGSGGTMFGAANKPAFGNNTSTTGTGSMFGNATSSPFGGTGTTSAFNSTATTATGGLLPDPPGTAVAVFTPYSEKEGTSSMSNLFQNILFQEPYKRYSAEELRLADYNQGRQFGNGPAGAAGAFGTSSGFGGTSFGANTNTGFGGTSTGSSLFGGTQNNTSTGFGAQNTASTNTFGGGGLFSQKPAAAGGLFGNTAASQPAQTGGLFSSNPTNSTGFGNTTGTGTFGTNNTTTGGGLFGAQNQNQNKPASAFGSSFGNNTTPSAFGGTGASAFGSNNNAAANTGGGLFGNQNQTTNTGGGLFGQNNQQQAQTSTFGSATSGFGSQTQQQGGGLFGGQQQKPATGGLFGNTGTTQANAGGGLFGGQSSTSSPFGQGNAQQQQTGGLFGQKPATGGLFGQPSTQQTGQSGGLFGNLSGNTQNQQQQNTSSLFGSQNQQKPSLFGTTPAQSTTGTGLFGQAQPQQAGSLFGNTNASQPQQSNLLGNSIFGASQNAQSTPQSLTASISDVNAYGTPSLFAGLGTTEVQNPGPLATPLSAKNKAPRKNSILPMWKLNPGSGSKFVTPVKRGFGFSYSTYGSPVTPSSTSSTPGTFGQSLLGAGNLNRSLSKSFSSSNLRRSINAEDSILSPGSFSSSVGPRAYGSGRLNKLTVDKSLRIDLFSPVSKDRQPLDSPTGPRKLTKRVSFDPSVESQNGSPATVGSPETPADSAVDLGYIRRPNGSAPIANGTSFESPEADKALGNELAVVQEESSPAPPSRTAAAGGAHVKVPGNYWMQPTKEEILKMNRVQMQAVSDFTVGRDNVGHVRFKVPVDLTNINIEDIPGRIVVFEARSCTVYPENMKKPPMGKGLNVPSEITLFQSWPRNVDKRTGLPIKSGRTLEKHISKLKSSQDTTFISYEPETGTWIFTVEHFTTYGLDYDDEDTDGETLGDITAEEAEPPADSMPSQGKDDSSPTEADEDTFEFRRKRRALPGAFDYTGHVSDDEEGNADANQQSFLSNRSAGSASQALIQDEAETMDAEHALPEAQEASAYLGYHQAAEPMFDSPYYGSMAEYHEIPGGIMRARMQAIKGANSPLKIQVADGDDWMDMLEKTISPQKRDRAALKSVNQAQTYEALKESVRKGKSSAKSTAAPDGQGFATSIELMNSLFEKAQAPVKHEAMTTIPTSGFKMPHNIYHRDGDEQSAMEGVDAAFRSNLRPSWGPGGTLLLSTSPNALRRSSKRSMERDGLVTMSRLNVISEKRDICFAKFANESAAKALGGQMSLTRIQAIDGIPTVTPGSPNPLTAFFHSRDLQSPSNAHEKLVWELASILFDPAVRAHETEPASLELRQNQRRQLSEFWQRLVEEASSRDAGMAHTPEDKAMAALSGHRVPDACKYLLDGKNFRLATLVSLIGTSSELMQDMRDQIREWRDANVLSEFPDPVRAIYELLAGNVCVVSGKKGAMENRMDSFTISDKFGMDWKQAFGLRLWYAITANDDVAKAIHAFAEDVKQDKEKTPRPWFVEQGIHALWNDPMKDAREDLLWGLLKLYADHQTDLADVLRPENSQLSPLDYRLCWQLGQALVNTGMVDFGEDASHKADAITLSFASQLSSEGSWLEAVFVLLHLSSPAARSRAIQEHLALHGRLIGNEQSEDFVMLTHTFKIPATWLWQAKALFTRSAKKDAKSEVIYLLRAASYAEAHKTLIKQVAPVSIIGRDYEGLWEMLAQFQGAEAAIPDWNLGGKIYADFLALVQQVQRGALSEVPQPVVKSLIAGLPAMQESVQVRGDADVLEVAAIADMAKVTAKVVTELAKKSKAQLSKVLSLPLTEDAYLKYSNELALAYYKDVMVGR